MTVIEECRSYVGQGSGRSSDFVEWVAHRPAFAGWDRRAVYQACLGRLPELEAGVSDWSYESARERAEHIAACLTCGEFRSNFADIVSSALPDKPRIFFVHIPRTGGTSALALLEREYRGAVWHESYGEDEWFERKLAETESEPLAFIGDLLARVAVPDAPLVFAGHLPLSVLLSRGLVRAGDRVFAIVRAPDEIIESNLSYIVDRVTSASDSPDAVDWRSWLAEIGTPVGKGGDVSAEILDHILRSDRFAREYANPLTRYFSVADRPETVPDALSLVNGTALTLSTLPSFLAETFGTQGPLPVANQSVSDAHELLTDRSRDFIRRELCAKDEPLWRRYDEASGAFGSFDLNKSGTRRSGAVARQLSVDRTPSSSSRNLRASS